MTHEGRMEWAIKADADFRTRGEEQRIYLGELTKLARGDPSANTDFKSDVEAAEAERRICSVCKRAFICRSDLFSHLLSDHKYVHCWGWRCRGYFKDMESYREHFMHMVSTYEDDRRERESGSPLAVNDP